MFRFIVLVALLVSVVLGIMQTTVTDYKEKEDHVESKN